jgi:hypothetical protein
MSMPISAVNELLSLVRQETYTGSNRCWPCTGLNVGLLACISVVCGVLATPSFGIVVFLVGLSAIWLRGYLVPYTPRLTHTLLTALPGVQKDPTVSLPGSTAGRSDENGNVDATNASGIVDELVAARILSENERGLSLHPAFHERWRSEIVEARLNEQDELAKALQAAVPWVAEASVVTEDDRYWIVLADDGNRIENETWLSPPAAIADLAALRALAARTEFTSREETLAAPPLRQFLEQCPMCDSILEVTSPHTCCGSPRSVAEGIEHILSCPSCDEIITAFMISDDERS